MIQHAGDTLTLPPTAGVAWSETTQHRRGMLRWLIAGALFFLPVQIETTADIRFAPSDLFLLAALVLGLGAWRIVGSAWSLWHVGLLSLFVVGVYVKLVTTGSVTQYDLVNKVGGIGLLFALYVSLTTLANGWGELRWFLKVFVFSVALQNTLSCAAFLWCRYTGSDDPLLMMLLSNGVDRLAGMLVDPNAYGGLLIVAFAIVLLDSDSRNPLLPLVLRVACLLSLSIGILLTSSRSAWLGFAALSLLAAARSPRLFLIVVLMAGAGIGVVAFTVGQSDFDEFVSVSSRQNTIDERVEINQNAWKMFLAHPWFGGGLGAFSAEHDIIVHNSAMWFLAEFGVIGFVIFVGFIGWFCVKGLKTYWLVGGEQRAIVAGLCAAHLAMMGLSLGVEALYQRPWWLVMGLLASSYALAVRDSDPSLADSRSQGPKR